MSSPGRVIGIFVGALAILGIGVYGPAMLLAPLPQVDVRLEPAATAASEVPALVLPDIGASALAVVDGDGRAETIAVAGEPAAVPIGGAAKLVTLLVTLESLPLSAGANGPSIPIGPDDYTDYLRYSGEGSRTLPVLPGQIWSQRDVVRAILVGSSNNHADTLVRWAFGGVDPYVEAANTWLAEQGFATVQVDDATGLSEENVGTADELARLGALVLADAELAAILDDPGRSPLGSRSIPDAVERSTVDGVRAVSRSFTDQGGLSYVFTTELPAAEGTEGPTTLTGAMLLMPDYETLDPAVEAAVVSAVAASTPIEIIVEGTPYGSVESAWGDRAELVAAVSRTDAAWGSPPGAASVTVDPFATAPDGREVGRVAVPTATGELASPLRLRGDIRDPGPIWRLTHPGPVIDAFLSAQED
ncbi:hypothetical protein [Agromyces sp. Marseille-P2726]|uniref:hypothetical protein n=1 Tax=Agromyces sp. Marseille-P2726 TaxID=2709132 RepID=UPI00157029E0|nr:hypothetical protein [Agromyces sp. Marseille-P2726]